MSDMITRLLEMLEVERLDRFLFVGNSPSQPARVFGGQVLAQALNAASRTVEAPRVAHSMHAYFLRGGDPEQQIIYEVDPIRDGRSFTTRRVVAKQDGRAIFNTSVSFQVPEVGLEHQATAPEVTPPESLETDMEYWARREQKKPGSVPAMFLQQPIERRPVARRNYKDPQPAEPVQHYWVRVPADIGDDPVRHQTLLAYISDFALLGATLLPHPYTAHDPTLQEASLDHAIWFHRPVDVSDFLLYTMDSPSAHASRGFARGSFYTRDGVLVASTAQECLIRLREDKSA